ncbi:MAG: CotY/CotZ family spore coat protein [Bacilli bacterium]
MNNSSCCINKILEVINVLQCQAEKIDDIPNTCDRPFLGLASNSNTFVFNTRPVTLYTSNNTLFEAPYTLNGSTGTSSVFRVERVTDETATLRVLAPNPDTTSTFPYVKTDSFIIVNTNCVCAIRCLPDTFIDCI